MLSFKEFIKENDDKFHHHLNHALKAAEHISKHDPDHKDYDSNKHDTEHSNLEKHVRGMKKHVSKSHPHAKHISTLHKQMKDAGHEDNNHYDRWEKTQHVHKHLTNIKKGADAPKEEPKEKTKKKKYPESHHDLKNNSGQIKDKHRSEIKNRYKPGSKEHHHLERANHHVKKYIAVHDKGYNKETHDQDSKDWNHHKDRLEHHFKQLNKHHDR